ncbi:hypothetical protein MKW92_017332 [Papaver armeniacum]|nr:hypothetical protein MKW92_017332 [Papaver armeniacum]
MIFMYFLNSLISNSFSLLLKITSFWFCNSVTFQRSAFRTSKRIGTVQNLAAKKKQELAEQVKDISKNYKE